MPSECRRVVRIRRLHAGALTPRRLGVIDFAYTICAFRLFHDSRYIQWALVHETQAWRAPMLRVLSTSALFPGLIQASNGYTRSRQVGGDP